MKKLSKHIIKLINENKGEISIESVSPYIYDHLVPSKKAYLKVDLPEGTGFATETGEVRSCDFGFGAQAKISSTRLQTFKKSNRCVCCNTEGSYYEKTHGENGTFHLNLYSKLPNGDSLLMTKDHIVPKSRGGKNHIDNYTTCCKECNYLKGNNDLTWDEIIDFILATEDCEVIKNTLNKAIQIEQIISIRNRLINSQKVTEYSC